MSTQFIHDRLLEIGGCGAGILLISEDLDESMLLCNRIYVFYKGKVAGELARADFDPYVMGAMMSGGGSRMRMKETKLAIKGSENEKYPAKKPLHSQFRWNMAVPISNPGCPGY